MGKMEFATVASDALAYVKSRAVEKLDDVVAAKAASVKQMVTQAINTTLNALGGGGDTSLKQQQQQQQQKTLPPPPPAQPGYLQEYNDKMAAVPLTDFDWRTLALCTYMALALLGLLAVLCMSLRACRRSRLERRLKQE